MIDGDRELQTVRVRMTPAPRRYSLIEIGGKDFYFDKFLQEAISLDEFAKQAAGLPIYYMPPSIESSHDYASARVSPVQQEINTGVHTPPLEKAAAHKPPLR